ncbi:peptidylprolyl isomerase [Lewinella sp. JB7]|uniref:peptidylprolyl isomerase n=1 Tax=Lewinella sp. JB7 TaxID=2962887 RepID=UPI0020CA065F|nr:peptidylprolyl isomerase [Lewinella sp. JB7]MCP9235685.1 peptidylprolyl isomerase [Lewinella sp. JB7]
MPLRPLAALLLLLMLTTCIPPTEDGVESPVGIDLTDDLTRRVLTLQNDRQTDSLLTYLSGADPTARYLAARAFGSFPTLPDRAAEALITTLNDSSPAVRIQAAYALGQSGRKDVAEPLVRAFDPAVEQPLFDAAVLQAVGKVGGSEVAEQLAGISTYLPSDTVLLAGRAWGMYYAALAGHRSEASDASMIDQVIDATLAPEIRHPAAHYLYRTDFPVDTIQERALRQTLRTERDPVVAMSIVRTLGRSGLPAARIALLRRLEQSADWRERTEVIRAFAGFEYAAVRESVVEALRDRHPLVALTAADFLVDHGTEADAPLYLELAEQDLHPLVAVRLYGAANRHLSPFLTDYRDRIGVALQDRSTRTDDPYVRAAALRALGEYPWMYRSVYQTYGATDLPVVRTAAAETLESISNREDFDAFFRGSSGRVRGELAQSFKAMITSREEGPAFHAARALATAAEDYRSRYPDLSWLDTTIASFELPRQLETHAEVVRAYAALTGTDRAAEPAATGTVRSIDWTLLAQAGEREVVITTEAGRIVLELYPEIAPATVSSFLELAGRGYYDGRVFHRVVPNFVAQGGGPRGDGYGSENFTVPTETPMVHWDRAGLVGMASAGKDTEGVQFFITHRPTPHLDGKYTIFAGVVEGQEIVDQLVPGSKIVSVKIR